MKTKSVLFASLAALSVSLFVPILSAEPPEREGRDGPPKLGEQIEHMKAELGLTDAQVEKLRPIFKAQKEAMRALHKDESLSKDDKRAKMKELRDSNRAAIDAVLTPEQAAKLKEMHKGKGPKDGERKGPKDGDRKGPPPASEDA